MRKAILGLLAPAALAVLPTTALAAGGHGFSWFMLLPGGQHLYYVYAALFIAVFLLVASAVVVGGRKTEEMVIPDPRFTLRNLFELILGFLQQLAEDIIGHDYRKYLPLLGTCFLFILFMNLIGLIPGFLPPTQKMNITLGLALVIFLAYKGPEIFLKNKATKRTDAIRKGLPDALDLLVICAEAGLTVDAAFNRVAKELGRAYPELGDEFALTAIELSFLNERKKAFDNLAFRVNLEAVKGVVTTMVQTERYGTPLASALRVLSAEFRNERMMRAEEKAARLPAIMTVPLIMFILPVLFIVILGPAACSITAAFE